MAKKKRVLSEEQKKERIRSLFLDSGAHSLFSKHILNVQGDKTSGWDYGWYKTKEFKKYVDDYATFVKENLDYLDYYVNVDVIFNPGLTWKVQQYIEKEHGLKPVPVIHYGTPIKWIEHYLNHGYEFLGIGGLGQTVRKEQYVAWADQVFNFLCDNPERLPVARTHGFAMTSFELLKMYPWWSVDSATWVKAGGFGMVLIPMQKPRGTFNFDIKHMIVTFSEESPAVYGKGIRQKSYHSMSTLEKDYVHEWLEFINVPLGSNKTIHKESLLDNDDETVREIEEWGVISHHAARKIANLQFFKHFVDNLPEYPWPFPKKTTTIDLFTATAMESA